MKHVIRLLIPVWILFACAGIRSDKTSGIQTIHPVEIDDPIANPFMGWGLWAGSHDFGGPHGSGDSERDYSVAENTTGFGDDAPLFSWIIVDWDWRRLEPREGEYHWESFDSVITYWSQRNKQFVVRFWLTDNPGWNGVEGAPVHPEWIYEKGLKYVTYKGEAGVIHRHPDYNDPSFRKIFLPALENLLKDFARRYDKPGTPIIYLQTQGYGSWADNATWYSRYKFPSLQEKHDLLYDIIRLYQGVFRHIRLMQFGGGDWDKNELSFNDDHLYRKGLENVLGKKDNFGLIWTGFIDHIGRQDYERDIMETYWKTNPIIAEGNWNYRDMVNLRTKGTLEENLELALDWHANFTHYYMAAESYKLAMQRDRKVLEKGLKSGGLGYRIVPVLISYPEELEEKHIFIIKTSWVNRNVGRLYERRLLKIFFTDDTGKDACTFLYKGFNITQLVQGETYSIIGSFPTEYKSLKPGRYNVLIALVDEQEKADIQLAIEGNDGNNRYKVGSINIIPTRE
ncbi:MAG: hypothetical protein ONB37_16010 [candidate division KSB1 bacterium]|nr:hypothetical protein [candidate division KSB1 bacterium]